MISETRYARAGDTHIAYRVIGDGPIDVLANIGFTSHVEHVLTEPRIREYFERIGEFARVLLFDRRGVGLSDPADRAPTLEQQVDDARAVLTAESVDSAVVYGFGVGAPFALLLAASEPQLVTHLVISSGFARMTKGDGYPHGYPPALRDSLRPELVEQWGNGNQVAIAMPSLAADPAFREWASALERQSASPGSANQFLELVGEIDLRSLLGSVRQPTLVMHPPGALFFERGHSDYLAEQIPDATLLELPGADLTPISPAALELSVGAISEFLTGERPARHTDRVLRTLLFTDIVESTQLAASIGDSRWHALLDRHDSLATSMIADHRGELIKTTGDGVFASFDGPERAVHCAKQMRSTATESGLTIRLGVHTGECEIRENDLAGLTVHIGARVAAAAGPDEILITRTVRDLVVGSDIELSAKGAHTLKGIDEPWELYAVA